MKLSDLGVSAKGQLATRKLSSQIQKGSVAAAKEPKLRLGVVGIEIGQTQSTGATSRINEEAISGHEIVKLLQDLGEMLEENEEGFSMSFAQQYGEERAFDREHAALDAVMIAKAGRKGIALLNRMGKLAAFGHDGNLKAAAEAGREVEDAGFTFSQPIADAFAASRLLWNEAAQLDAYHTNTQTMVELLAALVDLPESAKTYPFANAALKHLGIR
jgi:hypothetical protein